MYSEAVTEQKIVEEILRLKERKNAVILSHNYQIPLIQDMADFVGDSLELARKAQETDAELIVFCGADFMAETAKILNPEKKVFLPHPEANCPMAAMLNPKQIVEARKSFPDAEVVLYINTSAECKAFADICCTSANAVKVCNSMKADTVLLGPDKNLALFVQKNSEKKIVPLPEDGHCYVHRFIHEAEILIQKEKHSEAVVVVHPECNPEVQEIADYIGSTSQMIKFAKELPHKEFIIGTENGLLHPLQKAAPDKKFYPASETAICQQQKKITLENTLEALQKEQFEVLVPKDISKKAVQAIEKMLETV